MSLKTCMQSVPDRKLDPGLAHLVSDDDSGSFSLLNLKKRRSTSCYNCKITFITGRISVALILILVYRTSPYQRKNIVEGTSSLAVVYRTFIRQTTAVAYIWGDRETAPPARHFCRKIWGRIPYYISFAEKSKNLQEYKTAKAISGKKPILF